MSLIIFGVNHSLMAKEDVLRLVSSYDGNLERFSSCFRDIENIAPGAEAALVSTCLRLEALIHLPPRGSAEERRRDAGVDAENIRRTVKKLEACFGGLLAKAGLSKPSSGFFHLSDGGAVDHLFRVMAGFESEDIGEIQVIGQIRDSFHRCFEKGLSGPVLSKLLGAGLSSVMKLRARIPALGDAKYLKNAVIKRLSSQMYVLAGSPRALLAGRGRLVSDIARALPGLGFKDEDVVCARMGPGEKLPAGLRPASFDVVVTAVPDLLFCIPAGEFKRSGRQHLLIDLSVCRNIDVEAAKLPNVSLSSIDDIATTNWKENAPVRSRREHDLFRSAAISAVEAAAAMAYNDMVRELSGAAGRALAEGIGSVIRAEIDRTSRKCRGGDIPPAALELLARALIGKCSAVVIKSLVKK